MTAATLQLLTLSLAGCVSADQAPAPATTSAPTDGAIVSPATTPAIVSIPAGAFIMGSTPEEREYAYQLDEAAYGHSRTRTGRWYDSERDPASITTTAFDITVAPITNQQYAEFINSTNHPAPNVDQQTWNGYGLVHPYSRTRRHAWQDNAPPQNRSNHPVVLVSYDDANEYAKWLSEQSGETWRLPTETEWEKAVRGTDGRYFPWGNSFESDRLNSHDAGPFDTTATGARSTAGPNGLVDGAGQVFEWIMTTDGANRAWVKGGSWDDQGCGVCRPAARHSRPINLKHILIGFRLVKVK